MTRRRAAIGLAAALVGTVLLAAGLTAGQIAATQKTPPASAATSPDALLGQALHEEEVEGRLQNAIALYQKVLKAPGVTRAQAGRAQFRIGVCYERLGLGEARKAYEAVVANYADQADLAVEAKVRLAALAEPAVRGAGPVLRQIWPTSGNVDDGRLSPDGRAIVGVDMGTGDLVVRDIANGQIRRLTAIPEKRQWSDFSGSPVWSRDGRQIAYQWTMWERANISSVEFRIADVAGGTSRVVPMDGRFRMDSPYAWSPDGRRVLARVEEGPSDNRRQHLAWVPTNGGTVQVLASADAGKELGPAFLSPDGAWIVTRIPSDDTAFSVIAAQGGPPRPLMPAAASDALVGWSPDGAHALYISRATGDDDLMAARVVDGRTVDRPLRIRTLAAYQWIDVSQTGTLIYLSAYAPRTNVYRASFDTTSGRVGSPSRVDVSAGFSSGSVSWSPDGRRLAYVSWPDGKPAKTLSIWSAESGQTRSFSLPFNALRNSLHPTTWSADGRWVYASEISNDTARDSLYRIDTETGAVETVLSPGFGVLPLKDPNRFSRLVGWSPDGRVAYRLERIQSSQPPQTVVAAIIEHRVADHAERELFRTDGSEVWAPYSWQVLSSPDGTRLAFCVMSLRRTRIVLVPALGGPATMIAEFPRSRPLIRWTPDGRSLVLRRFLLPDLLGPGEAWIRDVSTGTQVKAAFAVDELADVAVSPDGKEIAYVGGNKADQGVWTLENFLPQPKGTTPAGRK